jgi:hypothetical protein
VVLLLFISFISSVPIARKVENDAGDPNDIQTTRTTLALRPALFAPFFELGIPGARMGCVGGCVVHLDMQDLRPIVDIEQY